MKHRVRKIGLVIEGTDHFIRPVEAELQRKFSVSRFVPNFVRLPLVGQRVNDLLLNRQLQHFLHHHDVVFFEWAGPLAAIASHYDNKTRKVIRAHRTEVFSNLDAFRWGAIDKIIFVSEAMRSYFLQQYSETKQRTVVVNNGVNLSRFSPQSKLFDWHIGMLGDLTPRKRVYDVICTLADLPKDVSWQLHVGGGTVHRALDYWQALQNLTTKLGVTDRVHFLGRIDETCAWFQDIDIFISASFSEGHQVALIEAMASGCYCLSHCWDGAEEILPSENLFTTSADLRSKLLTYSAQPDSKKERSKTLMRAIAEEKFDERQMIQQIIRIINNGDH